jgi:transketolase
MLRKPKGKAAGTIVLQGSGVTYEFVNHALPLLDKEGVELNVYYVASAELFDLMSSSEQEKVFPEAHQDEAMGITGFTLPTMYRWVRSEFGRQMTLYPYIKGHYLGSGQADMVMAEAGLDGASQFKAIMKYLKEKK